MRSRFKVKKKENKNQSNTSQREKPNALIRFVQNAKQYLNSTQVK